MLRVLRLDRNDPLVWQKALLKSEVTVTSMFGAGSLSCCACCAQCKAKQMGNHVLNTHMHAKWNVFKSAEKLQGEYKTLARDNLGQV